MSKHLDIGCGCYPRNPYNQSEIYGVDIISPTKIDNNVIYNICNAATESLPFPDSFFDSISAYDFLEHVPRVQLEGNNSRFPFIDLMNEIHRTLKPDGKFLALTPAFPKKSAFTDPTHINIITDKTHKYFTYPDNWARMYGFNGEFRIIRNHWCYFNAELPNLTTAQKYKRKVAAIIYPRISQHYLWELSAIK